MMEKPIYLDYQATTPIDPRVQEYMLPYISEVFGNSESDHIFGWKAKQLIEDSRNSISSILGLRSHEIFFTGGATDGTNIALLGLEKYLKGKHIITSKIEHSSIINTCKALQDKGIEVSFLNVQQNGKIDLKALQNSIKSNTSLIAIGHANNEIGTIQDIISIGEIAKKNDIIFFVDAAQSFLKENIEIYKSNIDILVISGHKIYAPIGIGMLLIRTEIFGLIHPTRFGGLQEKGLIPGTQNTHSIMGLSKAIELGLECINSENQRISDLKTKFLTSLRKQLDNIFINGDPTSGIASNLNLYIPGVPSNILIKQVNNMLAFSKGSACDKGSNTSSHVLKAICKHNSDIIKCSIRIGFGRFTTGEEVDIASQVLINEIQKIRNLLKN